MFDLIETAERLNKADDDVNTLNRIAAEMVEDRKRMDDILRRKDAEDWAKEHAHTLSETSKMPCMSYSISAKKCKVGRKLAGVEGSVCEGCYAMKGHYRRGTTQRAHELRLASIPGRNWVLAMVTHIAYTGNGYFRWHDSGDLQDVEHLAKIVAVCLLTPGHRHWLPTRERGILRRFIEAGGTIPDNLVIRLSAPMRDQAPPSLGSLADHGILTSTVTTTGEGVTDNSYLCGCQAQNNKCLFCRKCWDRDTADVSYVWH